MCFFLLPILFLTPQIVGCNPYWEQTLFGLWVLTSRSKEIHGFFYFHQWCRVTSYQGKPGRACRQKKKQFSSGFIGTLGTFLFTWQKNCKSAANQGFWGELCVFSGYALKCRQSYRASWWTKCRVRLALLLNTLDLTKILYRPKWNYTALLNVQGVSLIFFNVVKQSITSSTLAYQMGVRGSSIAYSGLYIGQTVAL